MANSLHHGENLAVLRESIREESVDLIYLDPRINSIVSVKGGSTKSGDVRDLKGTIEREGAALGIFLTLEEPTREIENEAATAGFYSVGNQKFPRIQILSAAEVIEGKRPRVPYGHTESLK